MAYQMIDGKQISQQILDELQVETEGLIAKGAVPCLAVVLVGDVAASKIYVRNKQRACEKVGIKSITYTLDADISEEALLNQIRQLNADHTVHGILVQLPLPQHIDENKVIETIAPEKDVDGFHPVNTGLLMVGKEGFVPCTPMGIIELMKRSQLEMAGQHCVVIGRSNIVGKPVAQLMLQQNATVTICHSRTKGLQSLVKQGDIIVAAIGKPKFVTADMVKPGAVLVDVGINRLPDGSICGDIDFDGCKDKCKAITPVPGGVGPMTIAMLMQNLLLACKKQSH